MRNIFFILLSVLIATSCNPSKEEVTIPDSLIPRDTLVTILFEVHLADAYLVNNRLPKTNLDKNAFYQSIFINHGYRRSTFDSTIHFLSRYPDLYIEIYENVIDSISLFEAEIEKAKSIEAEKLEKEREKRKEEFYNTEKITTLEDTVRSNYIHDSIFLNRVEKAKLRFKERKNRKPDSLKNTSP